MTLILSVGMILSREGPGRVRLAPPRVGLLLLDAYVAERHLLRVRLHADVARGVVGRGRQAPVLVLAGGLGESCDLLVRGLLAVLRPAEPHRVRVADYLDFKLVPLAGLEDG